eukprot:CAMPEP_0168605998 /NCGR_PEP_ID=MMETSP0420-20121227/16297_1 /TAXON_ID=498008 /ORGANISM="Pessonella sp." /LENGTH=188 /DNA_ID=CAMNT_0008645555 /DNA_START=217 /DNA_END=780 /DNA_ORIENTATION=-
MEEEKKRKASVPALWNEGEDRPSSARRLEKKFSVSSPRKLLQRISKRNLTSNTNDDNAIQMSPRGAQQSVSSGLRNEQKSRQNQRKARLVTGNNDNNDNDDDTDDVSEDIALYDSALTEQNKSGHLLQDNEKYRTARGDSFVMKLTPSPGGSASGSERLDKSSLYKSASDVRLTSLRHSPSQLRRPRF